MTALWQDLLANLAIIAIFVSLWTYLQEWIEDSAWLLRDTILAALTAGGTIVLMLLPFEIETGVFVDLRTAMIALAGLFGGPLVVVVTGLAAAAYRLWQGGVGAVPGVVGIASAAATGLVGHLLTRGGPPRRRDVFIFAGCTAAAGLVGFLFLPPAIAMSLVLRAGLPSAGFVFLATVVAGLAIADDMRRRHIAQENTTYRAIIDALPEPLNAKDLAGRFLAVNPSTVALMHADSRAAMIGRSDFDFYPLPTARVFRDDEEKVIEHGLPVTIEQKLVRKDGSKTWLSTLKAPLRDSRGRMIGLLTHNRDITDRKRLEQQYAASQRHLADALSQMADALVLFDRDHKLVFCNEQYREMFPRTADLRVPGTPFRDLLRASVERGEQIGIPPEGLEEWIEAMIASLDTPGDQELELADGRWLHARVRPTSDGASLTVISDITRTKEAGRTLAELNRRLEALAKTDALTGLFNRRGFDEALELEFARSRRNGEPLSIVLIDVDRFKAFNDTYGHPAGDECLRVIGQCLKETLKRPGDVAARYGGEELAAILPGTGAEGAFRVAEDFRAAVRGRQMPHSGSDKGVVTISAGISTAEAIGANDRTADVLRRADKALYAAKAAGRDRVHMGSAPPGNALARLAG